MTFPRPYQMTSSIRSAKNAEKNKV